MKRWLNATLRTSSADQPGVVAARLVPATPEASITEPIAE
jgi:hypothetical protein